jgi:hypothetical protein
MTNDELAEVCIESLRHCTPEQLREIRDSIRLGPLRNAARREFADLLWVRYPN